MAVEPKKEDQPTLPLPDAQNQLSGIAIPSAQEETPPSEVEEEAPKEVPPTPYRAPEDLQFIGPEGRTSEDLMWTKPVPITITQVQPKGEDIKFITDSDEGSDPTAVIDSIIQQSKGKQLVQKMAEVERISIDPYKSPKDKVKELQQLGDVETPPNIGTAIIDTQFPDIPDPEINREHMNYAVMHQENDEIMAQIVSGGQTSNLDELLDAEFLIGDTGDDRFPPTIGKDEPTTFRKIIDFINLSPIDPKDKEATEGVYMDFIADLWNHGTTTIETEAMLKKRLGQHWAAKIVAYTVQEVAIDLGMIALTAVIPPLGAAGWIAKGSALTPAIRAVLVRMGAMGIGSGSIHTAMNVYTEQAEATPSGILKDFAYESSTRAAGELGGEILVKGLKMAAGGLKAAAKKTSAKVAKNLNLPVRDLTTYNGLINDAGLPKTKIGQSTILASMKVMSNRYIKLHDIMDRAVARSNPLMQNASRQAAEEIIKIRRQAANLLGRSEDSLDLVPIHDMLLGGDALVKGQIDFDLLPDIANVRNADSIAKGIARSSKQIDKLTPQQQAAAGLRKVASEKLKRRTAAIAAKPASTPAGRLRQQTELATLKQELADATKAMKALDAQIQHVQGIKTSLEGIHTTTGNSLADKILLGQALGPRTIGETLAKSSTIPDEFHMYITSDVMGYRENVVSGGGRQFSKYSLNPARMTLALKRLINSTEPDMLPLGETMKDLYRQVNIGNRIAKGFRASSHKILSGLKNDEKSLLIQTLEEGSDQEVIFTKSELYTKGLSPKVQEAYFNFRALMDKAHMVLDDSLVKAAHRKSRNGFVKGAVGMYKGDNYNILKDPDKRGRVLAQKISDTSAAKNPEIYLPQSAFEPVQSMLPSHTGYLPHVYKDAQYHVSVLDVKDGTVKRLGVAHTQVRARDLFKKLRDTTELKPGQVMVLNQWDEITGGGKVAFDTSKGFKFLDVADPASLAKVKQLLADTTQLDNIRIAMDTFDLTNMRKKFIGRRSEGLQTLDNAGQLADAEFKRTMDAVPEYFEAIARAQGIGDWRDVATSEWRKVYKDVLKHPEVSLWDSDPFKEDIMMSITGNKKTQAMHKAIKRLVKDIAKAEKNNNQTLKASLEKQLATEQNALDAALAAETQSATSNTKRLFMEARKMQEIIQTMSSGQTRHEQAIDNWIQGLSSRMAVGGPLARGMSVLIDKYVPSTARAMGVSRLSVAQTKLLFFALPQFYVQGLQAFASIGAHPVHGMGALKDVLAATLAMSAKKSGKFTASKNANQTMLALIRSGMSADLTTTDIGGAMTKPAGAAMKAFGIAAQAPFKGGEAFNRAISFYTIRRQFIDLYRKGQLIVDGKAFTGAIDSDEFLDLVTQKAKITSFNMGRAGQLESLGGVMSVALQFKQVGFKFLNMFEVAPDIVTGMTTREKFGAAAALFGLLGAPALPFLPDIMWTMDRVHGLLDDRPTKQQYYSDMSRHFLQDMASYLGGYTYDELADFGVSPKFYERLISKGGIAAMTEGEIELTYRVALGRFIGDTIDNAPDIYSIIPVVDLFFDFKDAATTVGGQLMDNFFLWTDALYKSVTENKDIDFVVRDILKEGDTEIGDSTATSVDELGHNAQISMGKVGKVLPFIAGLDRALRNAEIDPYGTLYRDTRYMTPFADRNFATATQPQGIPGIRVTQSRVLQSMLGLIPGPVVDYYDDAKTLARVNNAWNAYKERRLQDYMDAPSREKKNEIRAEMLEEARMLTPYLRSLDLNQPMNLRSEEHTVMRMLFNAELRKRETPTPGVK